MVAGEVTAPRALPARLCSRPRILFVGINPSLHSAAAGHHFAGPGNPFWRLLHAARLVPEPLTYADDVRLPDAGFDRSPELERKKNRELMPYVVATLGVIVLFFNYLNYGVCNPFEQLAVTNAAGATALPIEVATQADARRAPITSGGGPASS